MSGKIGNGIMERLSAVKRIKKILAVGSVTVAYRQVDREWRCTALQFDIVGTGATREDAFLELQELVNSYLIHIFSGPKRKVSLFNPSDREEWEVDEKEEHHVVVALVEGAKKPTTIEKRTSLRINDVRAMRERVSEFELVPSACAHG